MKNVVSKAVAVLDNDSGASIVEYGVLTLGIVGVAGVAVTSLSTNISALMTKVGTAIAAAK
ncbi:Flp family type IVb pilin [Xanthobacter aminoxidans]|uniref:Flp family type IVb pilin n=1 Tax=Xanthobacter aminoxidans TaxID=186280 RepID=A0ABW6ZQC2_9HYPH